MKSFLILSAMLIGSMSQSALAFESTLVCDFNKGIPEGWSQYDQDGNTPSKHSQTLGFTVGEGWIAINDADGNGVAASTSWYTPAGKADDWLVSPAIAIEDDTYVLQWKARATDASFRDGYSIYISTRGNTRGDFSDEAVFHIDAENAEWTSHEISLSNLTKNIIWIAFVNDTYNCSRLYLDDVYVGKSYDAYFTLDLPEAISKDNYPIQGTVYNVSETAVNGFTITFSIADLTFTESFPTAIEAGESATFQLSETLSLPAAEIATYTCELESNGRLQYTVEGTVAYVPRKVVVEECTGSWCGYCVRGTVALEQLSAQYPESFIGIAVHNGDVLTVSEYDDAIGSNFRVSSYPTAVFNREQTMNPSDLYNAVAKKLESSTPVYIHISATYDKENNAVIASTTSRSVADIESPMAIAFVLTEDNVVMDGLYQYNAYSGSGVEMDGWENMSTVVWSSEKPFDHVARYISEFKGNVDSKVENLAMGESFDYEYEITIPENVLEPSSLRLIAMLLDTETGAVLNADSFDLGSLFASGISSVIQDSNIVKITYTDLYGRTIDHPSHGIYVRTISYTNGNNHSTKILVK